MPFLAAIPALSGLAGAGGSSLLAGLGGLLSNAGQTNQIQGQVDQLGFNQFDVGGDLGSVTGTDGGFNLGFNENDAFLQQLLGGTAAAGLAGGPLAGLQGDINTQIGGNLLGANQAQTDILGQTAGNVQGQLGQTNQGLGNIAALLTGNAGSLLGQGQGFLGQAGNTQGIIDDRLAASRAAAAPQEQQALNAVAQSAFGRGQLGGPGGQRALEAFGRGQGLADQQRIQDAQSFGLQTQNQLFGQGLGLLGQGGDFLNQGGGFLNQQFGNALQGNQFAQTSGQQRIQNMMGLLGFGQDANQQAFGQGIGSIGAQQSINSGLLGLLQQSIGASNAAANAGRNQADIFSANAGGGGGGLLGGLGSALGGIFG